VRPRRKVVVLAPLEDHISDWRMFLETRGQFRVLPALTLDAALEHLESESDCDLVVALRASRAMIQTLTYESGIRVLLVEDHPLNAELVRDLLEAEGLTVLHSATAEEALAVAGPLQPDLMLIDLALPGMDGLEATRRLKADPVTHDICAVVLTARAMKDDQEAALAHGCDAYMTKPLDTRTFAGKILDLLHARGAPHPRPPEKHP